MEILIWIWILTWMAKTAAQDVIYAVKGQPNPRYELKMQKALAAGQPATGSPRYGTRDWFSDLYSDALVAHTEKRRTKAAAVTAKPQPVDDMVDLVREPARPTTAGKPTSVVHDDQHPYCTEPCGPNCGLYRWKCRECGATEDGFVTRNEADTSFRQHTCATDQATPTPDAPADPTGDRRRCNRPGCIHGTIVSTRPWPGQPADSPHMDECCDRCGWLADRYDTNPDAPVDNTEPGGQADSRPLATVIPMFPINKEAPMSNAEITGLPTAIAFAQGMASAHRAASSAGGEEYVAALRKFEVGEGTISSVGTAREMSSQAAAAWERVAAEMNRQTTVKEAYEAVPDAGNRAFVTGE